MVYKIRQFIRDSRILGFFATFNKVLVLFFYKSKTHKLFLKVNHFFKDFVIRKNDKSLIVNKAKDIIKLFNIKDVGWFIALVVFFNTAAAMILEKEIDIFSISARIFFFCLGIVLFIWGQISRQGD